MIQQLSFSRAQLVDFCRRWKITKMALFGSVLREDFRPDSDVDVLVSFSNEAHYNVSSDYPRLLPIGTQVAQAEVRSTRDICIGHDYYSG